MALLRICHLLALSAAALLVACASTPPQATVQVFTAEPRLAAGTTYRHDRLPSQAGQPGQAQLEAAADAALARAGLRRDEAAARLAVQVTAAEDRLTGSGGGWWGGPSVGIGIGSGGRSGGIGIGFGIPIGGAGVQQTAQRVEVQLRDLSSGQVVFQSQASGAAGASAAQLVQAALSGFPNAPAGTRQVPLAESVAR